jgi:hypothetical protein
MSFERAASVCQKCRDLMDLNSIQRVGGPDGKTHYVCVFECECGRFAAEEVLNPIEIRQAA